MSPAAGGAASSWRRRLVTAAVVAGLACLFFAGLRATPLFEPDEGRYAEIPREMLATHDWVTPRLDGVVYLEKPPLYYWLTAAAMSLLGENELAARAWSALFGLAGVGLAWVLGRAIAGSGSAVRAALILGTTPLYVALAHVNIIDTTVSFFLAATLTCFWLAQASAPGRRERLLWYGMFAAAALAVLSKGLIGIAIPGGIVFLYLLVCRQWRLLRRVPWVTGTLLFLAVAVPWHVAVGLRNPGFFWFYFVREHVLRYTTLAENRWQPWWFFLGVVLAGFLPWSGLLPGALPRAARRRHEDDTRRRGIVFLVVWAAFVVVFFSLSHSKLVPYVLPVFVPLAVLAAAAWEEALTAPGPSRTLVRRILPWTAGFLALLGAAGLWAAWSKATEVALPAPLSPAVSLWAAASLLAALAAVVAVVRWHPRGAFAASLLAALCLIAAASGAAPTVAAGRSAESIARFLRPRLAAGDEVVCFDTYAQGLPFYLRRKVGVVGYQGELELGIARLSPEERRRRFPSPEEFRSRWLGPRRIYLVTTRRGLRKMAAAGLPAGPVLVDAKTLVLTSNDFEAASP